MLVPVLDDYPLGGYIIDTAVAGDPSVPFGLASLEACADYVFCRTHDFYEGEHDEATALATLFGDVLAPSFGFEINTTLTGKTADHSYSEFEDRTIGSAASELASGVDGPEWTTGVRWTQDTRRSFTKSIEIGPQVGRDARGAVFENKHLQERKRSRSWADRAVHVRASGDGSGDSRPMSAPVIDQAALDSGVPQWEARVVAPTVEEEQLPGVASQALIRRRFGTQTWETPLASVESGAPRLGIDFDAGDLVTMQLDATRDDPATWYGVARVIGWRADLSGRTVTRVSPVFWNPDEEQP